MRKINHISLYNKENRFIFALCLRNKVKLLNYKDYERNIHLYREV